jgi:hypothetical protein
MLRLWRGVEPHDEMVTSMMCRLEFLRRLREQIFAPVRHAAHDAAVVEDDFAGGFGDSKVWRLELNGELGASWEVGGGWVTL